MARTLLGVALAGVMLAGPMLPATPSGGAPASRRVGRTVRISMTGTPPQYGPASITIRAGDTVEWSNEVLADTHAVRDLRGSSFDADVAPGETFSHRFTREGEVEYGCRYHPWMRGRITVEPALLAIDPIELATVPPAVALARDAGRPLALALRLLGRGAGIRSLALGGDGALWWITTSGRVRRLPRGGGEAATVPLAAGARVVDLAASPTGVWLLDGARGKLVAADAAGTVETSLPRPDLGRLTGGRAGAAWLFTSDGGRAVTISDGRAREVEIPSRFGRVAAAFTDGAGGLWLLSREDRLGHVSAAAISALP